MNSKTLLSTILFAALLASPMAQAKLHQNKGNTAPAQAQSVRQKADGSSMARAVKIYENDTMRGIAAENAWLAEHLPQYRKTGQALLQDKAGIYDKITLQSPSGDTREVYFEISEFFGRIDGKLLQ